jgi:hypothetical protein
MICEALNDFKAFFYVFLVFYMEIFLYLKCFPFFYAQQYKNAYLIDLFKYFVFHLA